MYPAALQAFSDAGKGKLGVVPLRGQRVRLAGLSKDELNGRVGVCGALDHSTGRHSVTLDGREKSLAVRPKNLTLLWSRQCVVCGARERDRASATSTAPPAPAKSTNNKKKKKKKRAGGKDGEAAPPAALLRCSRCKDSSLVYCGAECQLADWALHKRVCGKTRGREGGAKAAGGRAASCVVCAPREDRKGGQRVGRGMFTGRTAEVGKLDESSGRVAALPSFVVKVQTDIMGWDNSGATPEARKLTAQLRKEIAQEVSRSPASKKVELSVYNKDRSACFNVYPDEPAYEPLLKACTEFGLGGVKVYLTATKIDGGRLSIDCANVVPPKKW